MSTNPPNSANSLHQPVLLNEAIAGLNIQAGGVYVDATFGRGGHSAALLAALGRNGRLIALDRDPQAAQFAAAYFDADPRFTFIHANYSQLKQTLTSLDIESIDGLLLDCGVSSPQLDAAERGFSFLKTGPLDMRMDPTSGTSAAAWLASAGEPEIAQVLRDYGEERFHRRIAKAIVSTRRHRAIGTTTELAELVAAAIPKKFQKERQKHPATKTFQAIRIVVNQELSALQAVLAQAPGLLAPRGRLVAIAFHSLEDRIVKHFMRSQSHGVELPLDLPVTAEQAQHSAGATLRLIGRARRPAAPEMQINPRARSASLRVAERLP